MGDQTLTGSKPMLPWDGDGSVFVNLGICADFTERNYLE